MKLTVKQQKNNLLISNIEYLDLRQTLDCGQAFRFTENPDGTWQGIAHGRLLKLGLCDKTLMLYDMSPHEFQTVFREYFDLDRDYKAIANALSKHEMLATIVSYANGIRVLKQEPWEALCSFILSQNNNVPRIKGIISRLCEAFGPPIAGGHAFPSAEVIASASLEDLGKLRAGFRAKYILDAARKVVCGEIDFQYLHTAPFESAMRMLQRINGVGPKVAECALLYGCGRMEGFPKDVWIQRVMSQLFQDGLPDYALPYAGIAQQYLFYYARQTKLRVSY